MSSVSLPLRMMKRPGMAGRFAALPSSRITIELCASAVWPQIRPSSCALRLPGTDPTSGRWVATSRWMPSARPRRPMARSLFVITEIAALPSLSTSFSYRTSFANPCRTGYICDIHSPENISIFFFQNGLSRPINMRDITQILWMLTKDLSIVFPGGNQFV